MCFACVYQWFRLYLWCKTFIQISAKEYKFRVTYAVTLLNDLIQQLVR